MQYGDVMVRNHGNSAAYFTENTYKQLYDLGVRQFYIWDEPEPRKRIAGPDRLDTVLTWISMFQM